jgi:hypothetical protein
MPWPPPMQRLTSPSVWLLRSISPRILVVMTIARRPSRRASNPTPATPTGFRRRWGSRNGLLACRSGLAAPVARVLSPSVERGADRGGAALIGFTHGCKEFANALSIEDSDRHPLQHPNDRVNGQRHSRRRPDGSGARPQQVGSCRD